MANYTVTGLRENQPFEQTTQATGTDTISDVFTLTAPAKISDLQWMLPTGDTLTVTIDFEGDGTHTATLYTSTATSGAALSGRSFRTGDKLTVAITGGTSGAKAYGLQFEAHRA